MNEKIVDEKKAVISAFDRGVLYGDGVFETMRSYDKKVFALDRHLDRLEASGDITGIKISKDRKYLKYIIYKLIKINRLKDAYIRLAVTRGAGRVGLDATTARDQSLIIIVKRFTAYPDKFYKKGVILCTSSIRRNERSRLCGAKTLNYLNNIIARMEAQRRGATDALLLNTKGEVAESAVSNIFMVKKKDLVTPSLESGALAGITREIVLSLAHRLNLNPVERRVGLAELKSAKEAFLTNTLMEVMPVVRVDNKRIANGRPGLVTKSIHRLYKESVK
ncbi:MAG: aminodeoxychorismate lyase [Candidatus Omnitrophica bacterium]|nr:aminodeoxychorismate lyase [Candidatus Omnitrophota bacterium]